MGIIARILLIALVLGTAIPPALAKPPATEGSELAAVPVRSDPDDPASDGAMLQPGESRFAQKTAAAPQPGAGAATPASRPDPVRAQKADNTIRITNMSGVVQRNYPLQLGRPFVCGEIAHYPQVIINGIPVLTQADVKNRCEDGSIKFAVIALMIPELPANGSLTLTFRDQATGNNQPLTTQQMLDERYNFDAQIQLTKPASISGSADVTLGNWKAITNGSLAIAIDGTTYQLTGLNFSSVPTADYINSILYPAAKAAKTPFSLYHISGQGLVFGGKTIALRKAGTGTDIAPLLFKSNVVTTPSSDEPVSASARQMLQNGACTPWTEGPVAQTMLCADDSVNRAYDLGFDSHRTFRPRFYVTFWNATHQVTVRYVGEISNSKALAAFHYNLGLTLGNTNPQRVYTQAGIPHSIGTRWTRTYWLNGTPEQKVNIDHNIGYLAATYLIPNYDPTVKVPESAFNYPNWQTADKSIGGAGFWQKGMAAPGARQDIGPMTAWTARWLYSGDWRARDIALTQGDLAGSWAMQVREGDPAKHADKNGTVPGLGKTVTRYGRPTSWGFDVRGTPSASDAFVILSPPAAPGPRIPIRETTGHLTVRINPIRSMPSTC